LDTAAGWGPQVISWQARRRERGDSLDITIKKTTEERDSNRR